MSSRLLHTLATLLVLFSTTLHANMATPRHKLFYLDDEIPVNCQGQLLDLEGVLEANEFDQERPLRQILDHLGRFHAPAFLAAIKSLGENDVWLDSGAGSMVMLAEFLLGKRLNPRDSRPAAKFWGDKRPKTIGLVYRLSETALPYLKAVEDAGLGDRLQILKDEKLETIDAKKLGRPRVITDFWGPDSYSRRPDLVMNRYFEVGDVGTELFILTSTLRTTVTLLDGRTVYFSRYLEERMKGHVFRANFDNNTDPNAFHITFTDKGPRHFPVLEEVKPAIPRTPPERFLREVPPKRR